MKTIARHMLTTGILLGLFAVIGAGLVALTEEGTREPIAEAERQALLRNLHAIIPPGRHDNDIYTDTLEVIHPLLLGTGKPVTVYRARMKGQPVAALFTTVAPDGYSGAIRLLVGVNADGTLAGVRVLAHKETPGLGDDIEIERSSWIKSFDGRSLLDPEETRWTVKKDGGVFDQFTGATITPRAVVRGTYNTLRYFREHRNEVFASIPEAAAEVKP